MGNIPRNSSPEVGKKSRSFLTNVTALEFRTLDGIQMIVMRVTCRRGCCSSNSLSTLDFVLTYAKCGELLPYINKVGSFDEDCTRFYAGEIVLALEHIHGLGIIHRDLKPENILLSEHMHILITDFGSAKILIQSENSEESSGSSARKNSFVGTAQYVSPELLTNKCVSKR